MPEREIEEKTPIPTNKELIFMIEDKNLKNELL